MSARPRIFISAVSKELHSARQLVANTLISLGYEPVWQDVLGTEQGDLSEMLKRKIDSCEGLIQLVGQRFGLSATDPRNDEEAVSYTQLELLYARERRKKVWPIILAGDYHADALNDEPEVHRLLQQAYRQRLEHGKDLYLSASAVEGVESIILKLRDDLDTLRTEWKEERRRARRFRAFVTCGIIVLVTLVWWIKSDTGEIKKAVAGAAKLTNGLPASTKAKPENSIATTKVDLRAMERSSSNTLTAFVVRPGLRIAKTNVDEVARYIGSIGEAVVEAERMATNAVLSRQLQLAATDRIFKEFVPEAVRVLKEAGEVLPLERVEQLNQIIVPRMHARIAGLITNGAPMPVLRESAGSAAGLSPMTHAPEQVAAFLIKLHDGITNANSELGSAATSAVKADTMVSIRTRNLATMDKTIREISKSPWTPKQFLEFRALVSDATGDLRPVRLTDNLTREQLNTVEAAFKSLYISGATTRSPPLASVEKNSPDEVAAKLFELLAEMKTKREKLDAIRAAGKDKTPESWGAAFSIQESQEEFSKILRNVAELGKSNWTASELSAFLGKMKGTNGAAFGALFDATYGNGETIIAVNSRQAMESYLGPLHRR